MYAYGDVRNPLPESSALLEEMTIDFLTDLCMRARPSPLAVPHVSQSYPPVGRLKVKVDDFKHALRKDPKKLGRLEELLYLETVIKEARRTFDDKELGKDLDAQDQANQGQTSASMAGPSSRAMDAAPAKKQRTGPRPSASGEKQSRNYARGPYTGLGANRGKGKGWRKGMGKKGKKDADGA